MSRCIAATTSCASSSGSRALIAIRNRILREDAHPADVIAEIREVAEQAGLDLAIARALDPQSLLAWLAPTGDIDEPRLWLMAELLYLEALQTRSLGRESARPGLERAVAVFSRLPEAWRPSAELPSAGERALEARRLLDE